MDIYDIKKINKSLWAIGERMSGRMGLPTGALWIYLVEGTNGAAVIDSGMGITDRLRRVCEGITDKPLSCYVTHGHPDHAGGACLFDKVYMAPEDQVDLPWALPLEKRMGDLECFAGDRALVDYCVEHAIKDASFEYEPLHDGDLVDLGGVALEVISVPGHTPGSMCFLNRDERYICVGDAIGRHQMFGESSTTVETYKKSLERLLSIVPEGTEFYGGHLGAAQEKEIIDNMIEACEEVLAGETQDDTPAVPKFKEQAEDYKKRHMMVHLGSVHGARLTYDADRIHD